MMKVVKAEEMKFLDEFVIHNIGISAEILMERAGLGVAKSILKRFPPDKFKNVLVVCGPGNNGGDGFVCARYLNDMGYEIEIVLLSEREKYKGEALKNLKVLENLGFIPEEVGYVVDFRKILHDFSPSIIVDAIFGIGLKRPIEGVIANIIEEINAYKEKRNCKIVAVDIPSGVCSDTGQILGIGIKADLTVTFELPKLGHFFYPGKEYRGELEIVHIGFPTRVLEEKGPQRYFIDQKWAKRTFKPRKGYTHKGQFGHLLILAGSRGKSGAGLLSALGALRGGVGLVTLASTKTLQKIYSSILPEILTAGLEENEFGEIAYKNLDHLFELSKRKTALVLGPGLGLGEEVKKLVWELLEKLDIPVVIDADALTIISENPERIKNYNYPKILTPHPGEAERLLKISKKEILRNPLEAAKALSELTGSFVFLKGPHGVIYSPDGRCGISSIDEPGLSQGGTGDVLTGLIGALVCQKYDPFEATAFGVFLHGMAAKKLAKEKGPFGYIASEIANKIPEILKELENDRS